MNPILEIFIITISGIGAAAFIIWYLFLRPVNHKYGCKGCTACKVEMINNIKSTKRDKKNER
jgi:hypothetical protein